MPNIFEEVDAPRKAAAPQPARRDARRAIAVWLKVLFVMVALMIAVGGMTRLTDSGLSITEWRPVTGSVPPLSAADWVAEFSKYQATPEYQLQNHAMDLAEFKGIYWWEWGHRQLGRLIGLVWALGYLFFLLRGAVPSGWHGRLIGVGALGGLQGAIGWWMVSSGLTGRMVDVASYRLATHLGLAFLILGVLAWLVFRLGRDSVDLLQARRQRQADLMRQSGILAGLVFVQVLLGALVAGIDAGRGFPTWPLMNGNFVPADALAYSPLWSNFFENPGLVQFNHRMLGYVVFAYGLFVWWRARASALVVLRRRFDLMAAALIVQVALGIGAVLMAAPLGWGITHQIGAVVLFTLVLRARFAAAYPARQGLRHGLR